MPIDQPMPIAGGKAPATPGVYALFQNGELIYYGSSETSILGRLQSHARGDDGPCTQAATHFAFEECGQPMLRKRGLLIVYQGAFGRLPRCNDMIP